MSHEDASSNLETPQASAVVVSNGWKQASTPEDLHNQSEETIGRLVKYLKENYFDKGITDEIAIRADLEPKNLGITTNDLMAAMGRLRAGNSRTDTGTGTPPTVEQMQNQTDEPISSGTGTGTGSGTGPGTGTGSGAGTPTRTGTGTVPEPEPKIGTGTGTGTPPQPNPLTNLISTEMPPELANAPRSASEGAPDNAVLELFERNRKLRPLK